MTIQHKDIPDGQLHEPKGLVNAPPRTVYLSKGGGIGEWRRLQTEDLQGISSSGTPGQALVSDGAGGFSYAAASAYGQIYFNASSFTPHQDITYSSSALANVSQIGQKLRVDAAGVYRVVFSANVEYTPGGSSPAFTGKITTNGTNSYGNLCRDTDVAFMEAVLSLPSGGDVWVDLSNNSSGTGQAKVRNGSLTIQMLAAA